MPVKREPITASIDDPFEISDEAAAKAAVILKELQEAKYEPSEQELRDLGMSFGTDEDAVEHQDFKARTMMMMGDKAAKIFGK